MDERKVIYGNGFQVSSQRLETQIIIKLETPVFDERLEKCVKVNTEEVADIRMHPELAKELYIALKKQIDEYEKTFGSKTDEVCEN